jgi:hypothetical protein
MNRKIVVAGAASALLLGSVAIAQTTAPSGSAAPAQDPATTTQNGTMSGQAGTTTSDTARSGTMAAGADQYGADTAAQAGDATAMAGERG